MQAKKFITKSNTYRNNQRTHFAIKMTTSSSTAGVGDVQSKKDLIENLLIPEMTDSGLFKLCEDLNLLDLCWLMISNDDIRSRIAPMKLKPKLHFLNLPNTQEEMNTLRDRFKALESAQTNWKISLGVIIPFESLQCKGFLFRNQKGSYFLHFPETSLEGNEKLSLQNSVIIRDQKKMSHKRQSCTGIPARILKNSACWAKFVIGRILENRNM